ncbi:hypothetical protein DQ04_22731000, partial [Trypanosoma grayi]|uniref:hypothetical protein n=1 Tax=Trypanosoma grayi TaxID=71804 RepID=UPI0004F41741
MSCDPFAVALKTAVNTRAPLSERLPQPKRTDTIVPATSALHRSICTTYDAAYGSVPACTDPSDGNYYLTLLRSQRLAATGAGATAAEAPEGAAVPTAGDSVVGGTQRQLQQEQHQFHLKRSKLMEAVSTRHLPHDWVTEQQASSCEVRPVAQCDFHSTARKIEREDDDRRGGLVGNTQRTVDIMRKRAHNPQLC